MPFVWSIGTIVGPCIGGTFADPHQTWPNVFLEGGLFDRFPYLLPNLICAALLFVSIILGYVLLEETHPGMQSRILLPAETYVSEETPLRETSDAVKRPAVDLRSETYGTFMAQNPEAGEPEPELEKAASFNIFRDKRIMAVVISLSIYVGSEPDIL
jgi:MFS family permease